MKKILLFLYTLLGLASGQSCPTTFPSPPSCDGCIPLTVGGSGVAVVPAGQTRCVPAGQIITVSEVDLKKGTSLIVCGTLVIRGDFSPNTNGANLWVALGGVVTVQGNTNLNTWVNIYNFGTFSTSSLNLNGGNADFFVITEEELPKQSAWTFEVAALGAADQELARAAATILDNKELSIEIFPLLFSETLNVNWSGDAPLLLRWFSVTWGEIGYITIYPGFNTFRALENGITLASLAQGIYFVQAITFSDEYIKTFVLIKVD